MIAAESQPHVQNQVLTQSVGRLNIEKKVNGLHSINNVCFSVKNAEKLKYDSIDDATVLPLINTAVFCLGLIALLDVYSRVLSSPGITLSLRNVVTETHIHKSQIMTIPQEPRNKVNKL